MTDTTEILDPSLGEWIPGPQLPMGTQTHPIVELNDEGSAHILLGSKQEPRATWTYDWQGSLQWEFAGNLTRPVRASAATRANLVDGSRSVVVSAGGMNDDGVLSAGVDVYDIGSRTW